MKIRMNDKIYRISFNLTEFQLELLRKKSTPTSHSKDEVRIGLEVANALLDLKQRIREENIENLERGT